MSNQAFDGLDAVPTGVSRRPVLRSLVGAAVAAVLLVSLAGCGGEGDGGGENSGGGEGDD